MNYNQDVDQLRLLSIFHYIMGGASALFSFFPVIHLIMGIAILSGAFDEMEQGGAPPRFVGWIFILVPLGIIVTGLAFSACILVAGRQLGNRTGYTFCLVIACAECLMMPFGTALGVFTIIVLMRPTVKKMFGVPV